MNYINKRIQFIFKEEINFSPLKYIIYLIIRNQLDVKTT